MVGPKIEESYPPSMVGNNTGERLSNLATHHVPRKGQRRNLGRQARKRRKKYLEIEAAASAFVAAASEAFTRTNEKSIVASGTSNATTANCNKEGKTDGKDKSINNRVLPTDRSYVLSGVQERVLLSDRDKRDLIRQLGYLPGNALQVVARVEDVFSAKDLQQLFAAAVVVTRMTAKTSATTSMIPVESTLNDNKVESNVNKYEGNDSVREANNDPIHDKKTIETVTGTMTTALIETMMKEPLVVKLYPLVLRDETNSTKRRRKRRRDEGETRADSESFGIGGNVTGSGYLTTVSEDQSGHSSPSAYPLLEPFPTIYWVTHPFIKALISRLELDKLNVRFEQRLVGEDGTSGIEKTDDGVVFRNYLASMKRAHNSYGRERRELLSERDMEYVKSRRWYDSPQPSSHNCNSDSNSTNQTMTPTTPFGDGCGVAGIRNPNAVKCLHAHAAHFWSGGRDNVVGYWVEQELKSGT